MSDKDFDWNDDLDFESLADEADLGTGGVEGDESFANLGDLADYADSPEEGPSALPVDEPEVSAELEPGEEQTVAPTRHEVTAPGGNAISAAGTAFLVVTCSLVGALGAGGALFYVAGINPSLLLDFSGLTAVDQILNFRDHPQNLLYLVTLGVMTLSILAASAVSRMAGKANRRVQSSEELLDRVTALRLDEEEPWSADLFKAHPDTAAFVSDVLGAWRLQQARQVKSVALEGELRRLEKAVRGGNRTDLADRYDHPLVGSVADSLVQLHDERETAVQEAIAVREKNEVDSAEIMTLIQDACSWNRTSGEGVGVQSSTLKRWADKFRSLAREHQENPATREAAAGLQGLQRDLNRELEAAGAAGNLSLDDLVDRGSKLAFQIAMEVARLGPRGERLLPMSQSLEELTTQFRQAINSGKDGEESVVSPQAMLNRIEQISVSLAREGASGSGSLARTLEDLAPAALKVAGNLDEIVQSYQQQDKRLDKLGASFGEMASLDFDPATIPQVAPTKAPEMGLGFSQNDPFGKEQAAPEEPSVELDPFGGPPAADAPEAAPLAGSPLASAPAVESDGGLQVEQFGFGDGLDSPTTQVDEFTVQPPTPESGDEAGLSSAEEKVYDLAEFGAVRIDGKNDSGPAASGEEAEAEERIYDLAEFGAVALT